ncbi:hypothetical protein MHBO_001863 [Bonamia ostreae]
MFFCLKFVNLHKKYFREKSDLIFTAIYGHCSPKTFFRPKTDFLIDVMDNIDFENFEKTDLKQFFLLEIFANFCALKDKNAKSRNLARKFILKIAETLIDKKIKSFFGNDFSIFDFIKFSFENFGKSHQNAMIEGITIIFNEHHDRFSIEQISQILTKIEDLNNFDKSKDQNKNILFFLKSISSKLPKQKLIPILPKTLFILKSILPKSAKNKRAISQLILEKLSKKFGVETIRDHLEIGQKPLMRKVARKINKKKSSKKNINDDKSDRNEILDDYNDIERNENDLMKIDKNCEKMDLKQFCKIGKTIKSGKIGKTIKSGRIGRTIKSNKRIQKTKGKYGKNVGKRKMQSFAYFKLEHKNLKKIDKKKLLK